MSLKIPRCELSSCAGSSNAGLRASKRAWIAALIFVIVAGLTVLMSGQQGARIAEPANNPHVPILSHGPQEAPVELPGVVDDWSHHRLIFSNPGTEEDALREGRHDEWLQIVNDPRYIMQQLKRRAPAQGPAADYVASMNELAREQETPQDEETGARQAEDSFRLVKDPRPVRPTSGVHRDWSMILGPGATVGAGMFPAKFSFNAIGAANCASASSPDFVVYNTSVAGSSTQASVVAYDNLYSSCTGQVPSVYWAFNTGGTVKTSVALSSTGSQVAFIQTPSSGNAQLVVLKWSATPAGRNVTGSVTSSSKNFSVSSGTLTSMDVGAGISGTGIPTGDTIATVTSGSAGTLNTAATATHSGETLAIRADAGGPDTAERQFELTPALRPVCLPSALSPAATASRRPSTITVVIRSMSAMRAAGCTSSTRSLLESLPRSKRRALCGQNRAPPR